MQSEQSEELEETEEPKGKVGKAKKVVKKYKRKATKYISTKLQILLVAFFVLVVVFWGGITTVLDALSGLDEITITHKTTDEGCYKIYDSESFSYCVDEDSFNLAIVGRSYHVEEYQYTYRLRVK